MTCVQRVGGCYLPLTAKFNRMARDDYKSFLVHDDPDAVDSSELLHNAQKEIDIAAATLYTFNVIKCGGKKTGLQRVSACAPCMVTYQQ